jgi:hypothetical protein
MNAETKPLPPQSDPLIDEIRAIRRILSEQASNDVGKLYEQLERIEREQAHRLVRQVSDRRVARPE